MWGTLQHSEVYHALLFASCKRCSVNRLGRCRLTPTCAVPSFQLVLLGVCLGDGLAGVDSMIPWFQFCRGRELVILMLPSGVFAGGTSAEDIVTKETHKLHKRLQCELSERDASYLPVEHEARHSRASRMCTTAAKAGPEAKHTTGFQQITIRRIFG